MLVGRGAETAAIDTLLAGAREGVSGVLVLRGEAGIGKSALLDHAQSGAGGMTVLRGGGVEVESELPYAALHQLLRPIFDRIDALPDPQAAALRAAFALSDETVHERFRVSLGVLGLLSEAAEQQPLLCLVDDAQWLDQASADALLFVARRLEAEGIAMVFAARDDSRSFVVRGIPEHRVDALSAADSRTLLSESLGAGIATDVVEWLVENANGNPLALVELPATLTTPQLSGRDGLAGKLPPTTSVEQVYLDRIKGLPESVTRLLLLAAAEETGARATVERAANELGLDIGELAAAESAGLVRVDSGQLLFRHPLVRSAIYRGAGFTERESAHRTLAVASAAEGSLDRAAWHRAAATIGTDEEVALALESTAERARLRSGHAAAAAALNRAAGLSADTESKARRLVAAAVAAWHAGLPERARRLLERAAPIASDLRVRAELHHLRGWIEWRCGRLTDGSALLIAGAEEIAPVDARKALEMLFDAGLAAWDSGDYPSVAEVGRRAAELPQCDDEKLVFLADVLDGVGRVTQGKEPRDVPRILETLARADEFDEPGLLVWAAVGALVVGEMATEAALLRRAGTLARASGAVDTLTLVLESVTVQGFLEGRYAVTAEATEGLRLAREAGLPNAASLHLAVLTWVAAVRGEEAECREYAAQVVESARSSGHALANSVAEWGLAVLDLGLGRPEEAASRLAALAAAPRGAGHPYYVVSSAPDLVEACVRAGLPEEARRAFAVLEGFAQVGAPEWLLSLVARCRGLLADDESEAAAHYAEALRLHPAGVRPFDLARTMLVLGEHLRRERRRTEAREHLRVALESFEALGAAPWAERARAELRATGETARKRDPSAVAQLTPQELQIASLVAEGSSNKEVAAQLFLSPRTVEYHLRKVFTKLGIASRAELIRDGIEGAPGREPTPV